MFTKNELYLAHGAINQNIRDVKTIFEHEHHGLTDEESVLLKSALPEMEKLKTKIAGYIKKFNLPINEPKEVYIFKITFFFRDGYTSISTTLPKPKLLKCTSENLLLELNDPSVLNKSGMLLFEYFLNQKDMDKFLAYDDSEYDPSIEFLFTEPV